MRAIFVVFGVLQVLRSTVAGGDTILELPKELLIGAATSSYQVEGAWNHSDKAIGFWDRFTHEEPEKFGGDNGDVACDSFHKYKEDVQLVKNMGMDFYRISLSWPRILPNGTPDKISETGLKYYKNLIDELLANGIEPFVTIFHFDGVQSLHEKTGGWGNESMIEYFADYARVAFREFGDKVKFWSTINEVNVLCTSHGSIIDTIDYTHRYPCVHNALKAHARAYHIYNDEFRASQNGKVGIIVQSGYNYPKSVHDFNVTDIGFDFETGWIMHPIFSKTGGYPDVMVQRIGENSKADGLKKSRLPEFSPDWIDYIKGSADYFGVNHYRPYLNELVPQNNGKWYEDSGIKKVNNTMWPTAGNGWSIVPQGFGDLLKKIKEVYGNPPVYILENGYNGKDEVDEKAQVSYLYSYMREVLLAIRNGADIRAYTIWSLLDNFEWYDGYPVKFGLYAVDFEDPERKRTPRLAVHWLKKVIAERRLIPLEEMEMGI